mmetsp:Transcript_95442/g.169455  ORF Transcript_95442/g.169455 Transcript_95442/m.169455 type:complete len:214 (-) Transcript_95442:94-735(-)|eukprot:CAMPEP_0197626458 /NCGR_PEP_ID=MMETSP1338-20131121/5420_1 /TAXON_ID=43686 ORGANISM="Pelagodinium beii, Strain RCC1491" /NCGR_SAMPLE_ID=MMETSP1338 /ASSEMBLY_ACC=CAM_ASM_000754 /LENGTH=213 /DNA_ID=CAMNT_0043196999 /DNA_START=48 /DNA_END=689 /DNA_ORIENTATION=+
MAENAEAPAMPQFKMSQMVPLGVSLLLSKVNFEELGYKTHVEIGYVVVQILSIGALGMIYMKIQSMPNAGPKVKVPEVKSMGQVVTPATEQTPKEYDESKLMAHAKQTVIGAVVLAGIYYKWGYLFPLCMQIVMTPMQLAEHPLFQIHMLGSETTKRPFPEPNPFGLPQAPEPPSEEEKKEDKKKEVKDGEKKKGEKAEEDEDEKKEDNKKSK